MVFYIYENWRANSHKVTIHQGCCGFCKEGKGLTTGTEHSNGKWMGPYKTFKESLSIAESIGVDINRCSFCTYFQ